MRWIFGVLAFAFSATSLIGVCWGQSGYQLINGTRVFTEIDQARGVATFSNDCGSQTLTQGQLQAGAIPDQIIPCPRPQRPNPPRQTNAFNDLCEYYAKDMQENCKFSDGVALQYEGWEKR